MHQRPQLKPPRPPWWFIVWFVFCALLALGFLGLIAWAIITLVTHFTR